MIGIDDLTASILDEKPRGPDGVWTVLCRDIWMRFGSSYALVGVNARFDRAQPILISGPNASGKSTLLSILAGLLQPTQGDVRFFDGHGADLSQNTAKKFLSYFGQGKSVYSELSALDNLTFHAQVCGIEDAFRRSRDLLEELDIDWRDPKPCGQMSHGQKRRVGLARALLTEPDVLLLDEPDAGLDRTARTHLAEVLKARAQNAILIVASHDELLRHRMAFRELHLDNGRILSPRDALPQDTSQHQPAKNGAER